MAAGNDTPDPNKPQPNPQRVAPDSVRVTRTADEDTPVETFDPKKPAEKPAE